MEAIAHSPEFAKKAGVPQSVGKDFAAADKGRKFKEGGVMKHDDVKEDKALIKKAFRMHDKQEHKDGKGTNLAKLKKGGMAMKKYDAGGSVNGKKLPNSMPGDVGEGSNKHRKFGESKAQDTGLTRGKQLGTGGVKSPIETEKNIKSVNKGLKMKASSFAKGGGIEVRGKTKGRMVTMCGGGMSKGKK